MSTAPGDYRGRRRAPLPPPRRRRLVFAGALLLAIGLVVTVRAMATGTPMPAERTAAEASAFDRGTTLDANAPAARGSRPSPAASSGGTRATPHATPSASTGRGPAPAVPPTTSPIPAPGPATISYEAESPDVGHGPGVELRDVPGASGGKVADGGTISFLSVAAEGGGLYTVVVFYLSPAPLTAQLTVDEGTPLPVDFPPSDDQIASVTVQVPLLVGLNSLEFDNAPALDRITVN